MRKPHLFAFVVFISSVWLSVADAGSAPKALVLVSGFRLSAAQQALAQAYLRYQNVRHQSELPKAPISAEWLHSELQENIYFSPEWLAQAREAGFEPIVIHTTSAKRSIRENGAVVREALLKCCATRPFWLLSHSAGTFYAVEGLRTTSLRPEGMVWMASPVLGHPVIDNIQRTWLGRRLLGAIEALGYPLGELSTRNIRRFWLDQPEWKSEIPILAEFHVQPLPQNTNQFSDPQFISPRLFALGKLLDLPSDGVVPLPPPNSPSALSLMWGGKERFVPYDVWSEGAGLDHTEEYANLQKTFPASTTLQPQQTEFVRSVLSWLASTRE